MRIFKGKSFYIKSLFIYLFLIFIVSFVSFSLFEKSFSDYMLRQFAFKTQAHDDVVLVMIDDKSTMSYRWPWQRALYGEIIEYFNQFAEEKVVVFDAIFNTYDKQNKSSSDEYFFNSTKKSDNFISGFMALRSEYENPVDGEEYDKLFKNKYLINIKTKRKSSSYYENFAYRSLIKFPEKYYNSLKYTGAVNVNSDFDGNLRYALDLLFYKGDLYPSIAMKAYMLLNGIDTLTLTDKFILSEDSKLKVPYYEYYSGDIEHRIKYYKNISNSDYTHRKYSAIDIINSYRALKSGKKPLVDPSEFSGKVVLIGANTTNAIDTLQTPISVDQPGADIQATIIDNLMHNDFLTSLNPAQNIFIILLLSIITFVIIRITTFFKSLIALLFASFLYLTLCALAMSFNVVPLVLTPLVAQLATMIFGYSYRFILEGRNKEKIKNAMGKYLSQDVMKNVVQNIDDIKLGGKKANVTVLFSDIRGFTSMSEKMTAEEVSLILNEYFSEMEPIITKYNGVINKFIGDAVMAIFGEPIQDINHPQNAVKCAYEMLKKVEQLREKWLLEGKPKIEIGVGINTGEAFVGNIGSEKRLEYTVIGDTVNLASRIEGYNKVYKTNFLISSSTYSHVSDIVDVIKIADVNIRGKSKKMDIYEVLRLS